MNGLLHDDPPKGKSKDRLRQLAELEARAAAPPDATAAPIPTYLDVALPDFLRLPGQVPGGSFAAGAEVAKEVGPQMLMEMGPGTGEALAAIETAEAFGSGNIPGGFLAAIGLLPVLRGARSLRAVPRRAGDVLGVLDRTPPLRWPDVNVRGFAVAHGLPSDMLAEGTRLPGIFTKSDEVLGYVLPDEAARYLYHATPAADEVLKSRYLYRGLRSGGLGGAPTMAVSTTPVLEAAQNIQLALRRAGEVVRGEGLGTEAGFAEWLARIADEDAARTGLSRSLFDRPVRRALQGVGGDFGDSYRRFVGHTMYNVERGGLGGAMSREGLGYGPRLQYALDDPLLIPRKSRPLALQYGWVRPQDSKILVIDRTLLDPDVVQSLQPFLGNAEVRVFDKIPRSAIADVIK